MSRRTTPIEPDSRRAWVATIAIAIANGTAFGTAYSFGTFFDSMAKEFGAARGSTAIVFGVTLLFFFGFGIISGPLAERVPVYKLVALGAIIFVAGLIATSRVHQLTLGYVTYGVGVGLGSGLFTSPVMTLVGRSFQRHRALALGVTAMGNGLGTLFLVPLAASLISHHGWRTAYVVLAVIGAVIFAVTVPLIMAPAPHPVHHQPFGVGRILRTAGGYLRERFFAALFLATLTMSIGLYIAFGFIVPFAKDDGVSPSAAARLMATIGLASILGRVFLTNLTTRVGVVRVYQATLVVQLLAYLVWLSAGGTYALLITFAIVLGVSYGGFVAIGPEMVVVHFGLTDLGGRMGTLFAAFGLGGLLGPPAAGYLADRTDGHTGPILLVIGFLVLSLLITRRLRTDPPVAATHS